MCVRVCAHTPELSELIGGLGVSALIIFIPPTSKEGSQAFRICDRGRQPQEMVLTQRACVHGGAARTV